MIKNTENWVLSSDKTMEIISFDTETREVNLEKIKSFEDFLRILSLSRIWISAPSDKIKEIEDLLY